MLINIKILLLLSIILTSCANYSNTLLCNEITLVEIIDQSKHEQKIALLYINPLEDNIFKRIEIPNFDNKFIYYELKNSSNILSKIIHSEQSFFVAMKCDSVISIFSHNSDMEILGDKLENLSNNNLKIDLKTITQLSGNNCDILNGINATIKLKYAIDVDKADNESLIEFAESVSNKYPFFYNLYLLSGLYNVKDSLKKNNIYNCLWESATTIESSIYRSELLEIFQYLNSGNKFRESKLLFRNRVNDIGDIIPNTERVCKYYFINSHTQPILLLYVNPSCGCTDVKWPRYPIKSGDNDSIVVKFKGKEESFNHKTISIRTSEPADITLILNANVIK